MNAFTVALISSLASLVAFRVGEGEFRVSLGMVAMIVLLERYREIPAILTSILTGLFVFLMRILSFKLTGGDVVGDLLFSFSLEIAFYIVYGLSYNFLVRLEKPKERMPLMLLLMLCDFAANSTEYFLRFASLKETASHVGFLTIFMVAFVRSAVIWVISEFVFPRKEV